MTPSKLTLGLVAYALSGWAVAQPIDLGSPIAPLGVVLSNVTNLPLVEGGMLSVAVIGLVAGIRMIQRKTKQKD